MHSGQCVPMRTPRKSLTTRRSSVAARLLFHDDLAVFPRERAIDRSAHRIERIGDVLVLRGDARRRLARLVREEELQVSGVALENGDRAVVLVDVALRLAELRG